MDSLFIFARTYLEIDTDRGFATGAPTGLVKDPWNTRLVPHYALGVFFVLAHLAAGVRMILLSQGARKAIADRLTLAEHVAAALVSAVMRVTFA